MQVIVFFVLFCYCFVTVFVCGPFYSVIVNIETFSLKNFPSYQHLSFLQGTQRICWKGFFVIKLEYQIILTML